MVSKIKQLNLLPKKSAEFTEKYLLLHIKNPKDPGQSLFNSPFAHFMAGYKKVKLMKTIVQFSPLFYLKYTV